MILITSSGVRKLTDLEVFLGCEVKLHRGWGQAKAQAVAGWGLKATSFKARKLARKLDCPYWALEDGFVRSVKSDGAPISMIVDDIGIYYDANRASRLESLIASNIDAEQTSRANAVRAAWCAAGISKYNHMRDYAEPLPDRYVLLADQTYGDASIEYGMASSDSFGRMLDAALLAHPQCTVVIKVHPDVVAERKHGFFDLRNLSLDPRIRIIAGDAHPVSLIAGAEAVYVVTSQMGFDALLHGKPVHTFGMPFYAGWGLTTDALPAPARRCAVSVEKLVHAALITYPRYLDPETGERCEIERVIEWMGWQRLQMRRFPSTLWAVNFSAWKRPVVEDFFRGSRVRFVDSADDVPSGVTAIVWGLREAPQQCRVIRLEDGFLRSVGLGSDLIRPLSWVQDQAGLYYDTSQPSDLEQMLNSQSFEQALLQRAARLRQRIVETGLSKYNLGGNWRRPPGQSLVVLVPGQVESDASLKHGDGIRRNIDLLKAVRQAKPEAYVVYKPHPDVLADMRRAGANEEDAKLWCDEIVGDVSMPALLAQVDTVHVMTSLSGFEALLRGIPVTTYNQPFYAGWGLTQDHYTQPRRTRLLTLDELVAACLILYPCYVSQVTRCFTTPERVVDELLAWRNAVSVEADFRTRLKRMVLRLVVGVR